MYGGKFAFQNRLGQHIVGRKLTVFALLYFVFEGNFPSTSPRGAYFLRGDFTEVFLCYEFRGLTHGGAYFRNFTVVSARDSNMAAYQHFQKRIYQNFESNIGQFLVSSSNELGKVWEETEEENLVPVVKIVKGTGEDSGRGSVHCEEGFLPFTQAFPNPL